jgi:acetyltransferase-like isoleucine patch superfamily enzyme
MKLLSLRKKIFKLIAKHLPGCGMRIRLLKMCGYSIGRDVYIGEDIIIIDDLSKNIHTLSIGDRASIAPRVTFVLHSQPNDSRIVPYVHSFQGSITIGPDAWIGAGAVILPDVSIGEGAVIGANSVVTRSIAPYTVVGGVPARFIKKINVPWYDHSSEKVINRQ